jgi:hypothetical protein
LNGLAQELVSHQLPVVPSEALTFALLGAWGAAPKMTCLISTVGGAAARDAQTQQHGQQQSNGELPKCSQNVQWIARRDVMPLRDVQRLLYCCRTLMIVLRCDSCSS